MRADTGETSDLELSRPAAAAAAVDDLARAIARVLAHSPAGDPWAKYPPVLTVKHVAEILESSVDAVREGARRGKLPLRRRHGCYRVDQVTFRRWLSEGDDK